MRFTTIEHQGLPSPTLILPDRGLALLSDLGWGGPNALLDVFATGVGDDIRAKLTASAHELEYARLLPIDTPRLAPYRTPRKIWGIGLNYREHATDLSESWPTEPASFIKGDHTIIDPGMPIVLPAQSERVTAEGELGLIIGRECYQVEENEALQYIGALCSILDQTAEDILARNPRFLTRSKNFPTFFSFGPELVTLDEALTGVEQIGDLEVETVHNGSTHSRNFVRNMAFSPEYLISFHSQMMPLFPGDIISTGTPGAVHLANGDEVTGRVQNVGETTHTVEGNSPGER